MASGAYEDGYVQGVRDAAAWSVQSAVRVERLAIALETLAIDLARQARAEVDNAQRRWAENADLRDEAQVARLKRSAKKGRKSDLGPTLNLTSEYPSAPAPEEALGDEAEMRRAAGKAWRT